MITGNFITGATVLNCFDKLKNGGTMRTRIYCFKTNLHSDEKYCKKTEDEKPKEESESSTKK